MHDEEFLMFDEDTIGRERGFDIERVYESDSEDDFDDERDFEDVDDLDELLAVDKEVEDIIHERSNIPKEDLRDEDEVEEEEEDDEEIEYDEDGNPIPVIDDGELE